MARCDWCGGLGRVASGGISARFAGVFGAEVRECGRCHGTGRADPLSLPGQRTTSQETGLPAVLPGEWLVEIHGHGRILSVMRFLLTCDSSARHFDARCDYGGLPDWAATGAWTGISDTIGFAGTQSSPYLLTTGYRWRVTLRARHHDVLHGESIANEWTMWSRKADPTQDGEPLDPIETAAHRVDTEDTEMARTVDVP